MDEKKIKELLKSIPGSRRTSNGIAIDLENGMVYQIYDILSKESTKDLSTDEHLFVAFCSRKEILRLRNLKSADDYLLNLRAKSIVDCPRKTRVMRARRKKYEERGKPWSLTAYYHSRNHYHKDYLKLISNENRRRLTSIPTGLAFISDPNAICIKSMLGEVVAASESLEYFYYFMTLGIFGHHFKIDMADRINALLIGIRLMIGTEALDFDLDPRGHLPIEIERKIRSQVAGQMHFTFGHEFSHILLGHLPDNSSSPNGSNVFGQGLEFDADLSAINLVSNNEKMRQRLAYSAYHVFHFLDFLYEFLKTRNHPSVTGSSTHPPPRDRMVNLATSLKKSAVVPANDLIQSLENSLSFIEPLNRHIENASNELKLDALNFYGSLYLPNYKKKKLKDRIDF